MFNRTTYMREYMRKYLRTHPIARARASHKKWRRRKRFALLKLLGNKCAHCGFTDKRALQIDHKRGGGTKEKRERYNNNTYAMVNGILAAVTAGSKEYQLLCANCNWIKRAKRREYSA